MTKLTVPLHSGQFHETLESLDRSQRPEYIFENLYRVMGGDENSLLNYAVEAKVYWEKRCCSMLEYSSPAELYQAALQGKLPKVHTRERDAILRLARALCDEARFGFHSETDEIIVNDCYYAEALLCHINSKKGLLRLYIDFPHALRRREISFEILEGFCIKALAIARETGEQEGEMQALNNYARIHEMNRDFRKALNYHTQALEVLENIIKGNNIDDSPHTIPIEYLFPKSALLFAAANCKGALGEIKDTIALCNQAAAFVNRLEHDDLGVHIHLLLARSYSTLGEHQSALKYLLFSASIAESLKSPFLIGQTKMLIANTYSKLGDFQKAIEYGLEAVDAYKHHESLSEYLIVCGRIGSIMVSGGEFDRATEFFNDILQTIEKTDKSVNLDWQKSVILQQLARIAIHRKQWDNALLYLQFPLELIDDEKKLPHLIIEILVIATDAFIGANQYDKASNLAERALTVCKQSNDLHNQYRVHEQLAKISEQRNDTTGAFYQYKEFHRLKEQVFNEESDQRNKNMLLILEEKEAIRVAQAERLRRYELEEEIGQLSTALVHRDQALKEIRSALKSMKSTNDQVEQFVQVLQTVLRTTERTTATISTKTYKTIDEVIEKKFPSLSRVQRELSRFIVLGYTTKDIAGLMGISVQSVHTQRYRVRTRLGLGDEESLDSVIKLAVKQE
ncbi:MAG: tetratricopeptide repeat protein [Ignavibacteriae bacterium]|nr:tetratricopeptide repeat protein [Ignavibacteriota bacterium]